MAGKRIAWIDVLKGICMVMIVVSHAGLRPLWFSYFYVYGFYFISGYTFSNKSLTAFLKKKIARLYIPYLVAQLIAIPVYYFEKVVSGGVRSYLRCRSVH